MKIEKFSLISDTVHGTIRLSQIEMEIVSSPIFNRLHDVLQNSTAYLTFPTNRTKRFEHSVGTMFLAGEILKYSITNADENTLNSFFDDLKEIIDNRIDVIISGNDRKYREYIGDKNYNAQKLKSYNDISFADSVGVIPDWIPFNVKRTWAYVFHALIQSVRLAGLMHDVGHPPFSHVTESAMRDLWHEIANRPDRGFKQEKFYKALSEYFSDGGELHEKIGNKITDRLLQSMTDMRSIPDTDIDAERLHICEYRVMVIEMTMAILNDKGDFFSSIHKIISSSLDADRLDYVTRDVINSGLDNGAIEYDRLLPRMRLMKYEQKYVFAASVKSIGVLDDFYTRRWNLYKKIIFHHRVIKTDYLLNVCTSEIIRNELKDDNGNGNQDNQTGRILPYNISGLWEAVELRPSDDESFNRLIQWDDGWLMVILKKTFLEVIEKEEKDRILEDKLKELIASEKHYYSIVKRAEMFNEIESAAISSLKERKNDINALLKRTDNALNDGTENIETINIDYFLGDICKFVEIVENYTEDTYHEKGFVLGRVFRLIFQNYIGENDFKELLNKSVAPIKNSYEIKDIVVEIKSIKPGIKNDLLLYDSENNLSLYNKMSHMSLELAIQREFVLPFYIYVNCNKPKELNYKDIRKTIGENIGANIADAICNMLQNVFD